jgi:RNA polymerase sigma factor (sigma-70 family)
MQGSGTMYAGEASAPPADLRSEFTARFHGPLMAFFLRRIQDPAEAEDLTQEVLLRVVRMAGIERVERAESFVFKIAINLLRDRRRRVVRAGNPGFVPLEDALASELESELVEDLSPERVILSRDTLAEVLRTLDELGERTRNIFILFRLENMKQKDIAALYGIAQSTVEKHVMRAVLHLARRYGRT